MEEEFEISYRVWKNQEVGKKQNQQNNTNAKCFGKGLVKVMGQSVPVSHRCVQEQKTSREVTLALQSITILYQFNSVDFYKRENIFFESFFRKPTNEQWCSFSGQLLNPTEHLLQERLPKFEHTCRVIHTNLPGSDCTKRPWMDPCSHLGTLWGLALKIMYFGVLNLALKIL